MRAGRHNRVSLIVAVGTVLICIAWVVVSRYLAPEIIRSAYYGTSWQSLNGMITGQATHPLSDYLSRWSAFAWDMLLALMLAGLSAFLATRPEIRDAFWGREPTPSPPTEVRTTEQGIMNRAVGVELPGGSDFSRSWSLSLVFGAILPLALLLRMLFLGAKSLSEDEIFSAIAAHAHLLGFWQTVTHGEANMVLYYAILRFWIYVGHSAWAIRSLSVIFAVATVPLIYCVGAHAFGRKTGLLAALLLAISGFHIDFSQDARSYSLLMFLVTLSSLLFLQAVRNGSRRNWTRYIVVSALAVYAHIFAVLVLVAHGASLLFLSRKRAPWRRMIPSAAAIAFLAFPMELFVLTGNHGQLNWVQRTSLERIYAFLAHLAGQPQFSPRGVGTSLLLLAYLALVIVAAFALVRFRLGRQNEPDAWHLTFFLTWLLVPILLTLAISVREPAFVSRFLIICLPPFLLLASYGLSRLRGTWLPVALLCVITVLTIHGLVPYYESAGQNWRGEAQYVYSNERPGDEIIFSPRYFVEWFKYYFQKEPIRAGVPRPHVALAIPPSDAAFGRFLRRLPSHYDRVWLVTTETPHIKALASQKRFVEKSLCIEFPSVPRQKQFSGGLEIILYSKRRSSRDKKAG